MDFEAARARLIEHLSTGVFILFGLLSLWLSWLGWWLQ